MKRLFAYCMFGFMAVASNLHAESINILVESGGEQLQKDIAAKFTNETGIGVKFTVVPYEGVFDKLSASIASGKPEYDVATIDVVWNATLANHVENLDRLFTPELAADLPAALLADSKFGSHYIAIPVWANIEIIFYRKDLFENKDEKAKFKAHYGYDLAPPATWQQWRDIAKFFTRSTKGDGKTDFWGTDVIGMFAEEWMAHVLQAGSPGVILDQNGKVIIDNAAHKAALDFYIAPHCTDKSVPDDVNEIGWGEAQNLFYQGRTAMMKSWAHAYKLTPKDSKVEGKVGVAPMIAGTAGIAGIPGPWYNVIPKGAANKDGAVKFVSYAIAHNVMGIKAPLGLAATNSAYESYMGRPGYEHFGPLLATLRAPATQGRPLNAHYQEILDEAVLPAVQKALTCKEDVGTVLSQAKKEIEAIVK
jgi:ABC-type glycerol-3-phosphate transport system substrate-binding protein